jgi:HTH-type transcriptional regulator/antitoxin HigA
MNAPDDPTDLLRDELHRLGWTQQKLAGILGRPPQMISEVMNGKKEITRRTALQLDVVTGVPAETWLEMQDAYNLWLLRRGSEVQVELALIRDRVKRASA